MKVHRNSALDHSLGRLLIVDDESDLLTALCEMLADQGYETVGFIRGKEAIEALKEKSFDLMLTDLKMPEMDGITLIREALQIDPNLVTIVMTGHGIIETAVETMKLGALDYVLKPFKLSLVLPVLSRAMKVRRLRMENIELHKTLAIYELSMATAFVLEQNIILDKMADTIIEEFKVDELSIMLPTEDNNELYVAIARGENRDHILGYRMPVDHGIAGWVAQNKETITLQGEVDDPRFTPVHPRSEIPSSVSVPMLAAGKVMGVLNVNAIHRHHFTPGDVKALNILSNIAGSALESARLYEQVRVAETKYRSIFENAMEGIYQGTPDGRFLSANPAMARMLGYDSPEELISSIKGIGYQLYVEPKHRSEFIRLMDQDGFVKGKEFQVYHKDGSVIWISENARAVKDNSGKVLWYEGMCENITNRKRADEELEKHRNHLEEMIEERTAELRTIVNAMAGREVRMAELKETIRKLRAQLEEAGLTPVADDPLREMSDE